MPKLRLFRNLFDDKRGMTLVMTLGVLVILSVVGTTLAYYSTANAKSSNAQKGSQNAYALAEAGINNAISVLANAADPTVSSLLPSTMITLEGGTATYSGTLSGTL